MTTKFLPHEQYLFNKTNFWKVMPPCLSQKRF